MTYKNKPGKTNQEGHKRQIINSRERKLNTQNCLSLVLSKQPPKPEANKTDWSKRPTYTRSQLFRNNLGSGPVRTKPIMSRTIGLRPKHPIAPYTRPARCLMGRSGSNCRKMFVTVNAFQLLNPSVPTVFVVNSCLC